MLGNDVDTYEDATSVVVSTTLPSDNNNNNLNNANVNAELGERKSSFAGNIRVEDLSVSQDATGDYMTLSTPKRRPNSEISFSSSNCSMVASPSLLCSPPPTSFNINTATNNSSSNNNNFYNRLAANNVTNTPPPSNAVQQGKSQNNGSSISSPSVATMNNLDQMEVCTPNANQSRVNNNNIASVSAASSAQWSASKLFSSLVSRASEAIIGVGSRPPSSAEMVDDESNINTNVNGNAVRGGNDVYFSSPSSPVTIKAGSAANERGNGNNLSQSLQTDYSNFLKSPLNNSNTNGPSNKTDLFIVENHFHNLQDQSTLIREFDPLSSARADSSGKVTSLLDLSNDYTSGTSVFKYTEEDLQAAISAERSKAEKESEMMQLEISNLQQSYQEAIGKKDEIEGILNNYQETMNQMIKSSKQKEEEMKKAIDTLIIEKQSYQAELMSVTVSFKDLHSRYEDLKLVQEAYRRNEETLKETIKSVQKDVHASELRYDTLKRHAEQKIEEANREIAKVRASYEAKLLKAEITQKSLEDSIQAKVKENEELMKICEQLIQKMDG